jgi:uncharacterized membrane protein YecN with MAPEG domain
MHTAPYFTAFGLIAILNSMRIVMLRRRLRVSLGDGGHQILAHAIRGFGNFMEYVPFGLVLLLGLEVIQAPVWFLHLCGGTFLVGRVLHSIAFMREDISMNARVTGMVLTYTALFFSAIGLTLFSMLEIHG